MLLCLPVLCLIACIVGTPVLVVGASVPKVAPLAIPGAVPQAERVPVLVELFTSESCAACSAAGDVVRSLGQKQPIPGVEMIGLEMRVDSSSVQGFPHTFPMR